MLIGPKTALLITYGMPALGILAIIGGVISYAVGYPLGALAIPCGIVWLCQPRF